MAIKLRKTRPAPASYVLRRLAATFSPTKQKELPYPEGSIYSPIVDYLKNRPDPNDQIVLLSDKYGTGIFVQCAMVLDANSEKIVVDINNSTGTEISPELDEVYVPFPANDYYSITRIVSVRDFADTYELKLKYEK